MAVQNSDITTENLLNAVVRMPERGFESFIEEARRLRNGEVLSEADLLHKINTIYSSEKRQRYNELYAKFKAENISGKERKELIELNDEIEMLYAECLRYIGELATLRGQGFEETFKDLGIKNTHNK